MKNTLYLSNMDNIELLEQSEGPTRLTSTAETPPPKDPTTTPPKAPLVAPRDHDKENLEDQTASLIQMIEHPVIINFVRNGENDQSTMSRCMISDFLTLLRIMNDRKDSKIIPENPLSIPLSVLAFAVWNPDIDVKQLIEDNLHLILDSTEELVNTKNPYYVKFSKGIATIGTATNKENSVRLKLKTVPEDAYIAINNDSLQLVTIVRNKIVKKNLIYIPENLSPQEIKLLITTTTQRRVNAWDFLDKTADLLGSLADIMGWVYLIPVAILKRRRELKEVREEDH